MNPEFEKGGDEAVRAALPAMRAAAAASLPASPQVSIADDGTDLTDVYVARGGVHDAPSAITGRPSNGDVEEGERKHTELAANSARTFCVGDGRKETKHLNLSPPTHEESSRPSTPAVSTESTKRWNPKNPNGDPGEHTPLLPGQM
eukprot:SAG31_NODE_4020_length_3660_cov_2.623701_5_plen_146_part_00